ncbi:hypothetical protein CHLRE_06g262450v5 [Chlamydomonas reinhardtii]|uniref:phytol kinase n=1 Tax=Chlamydomonas reinhardtii TaxID=3055 RepID=A0A2K3DMR6_CHLRE|nr:uncharacterized protein CHLRE_06g262450v5 [Chlamydomonas reinhardtii]PNW81836.1 hypothetical protein CHLRE_06g262450v5 [Chlamydomonas reinhardtii]
MGGTYVLHWALFTQGSLQARVLCALVPFTATLVFALVGLGLVPLDVLVKTATRSGRREELLSGPLLYGLVHSLLTVVFFTASPAGAIAVAVLCWGDGAAELAGRSYGVARLPHSPGKTWAGSAACLVAGFVFSLAYASLFRHLATFDRPVSVRELAVGCGLCAAAGTLAESLPLEGDNLWVPLATVVTSVWWFGF